MNVARILGVRSQGFVEDQLVMFPGIEGRVVHCDPNGCMELEESHTTPFARRVYNDGSAPPYGNDHPGWE